MSYKQKNVMSHSTNSTAQQNMMSKRAILLFLTQAVSQALTFSTVEDYTNPIVIVLVKTRAGLWAERILIFNMFLHKTSNRRTRVNRTDYLTERRSDITQNAEVISLK